MQQIITFGEIWAGLAYIFTGIGFVGLSQIFRHDGRAWFVKAALGLLFTTAGIEELFDAAIQEGPGLYVTYIQFGCTLAQIVFNTTACWIIYQAHRWEQIK